MYERLTEIHRAVVDSLGFDEVLRLIAEHAAELVAADVSVVLLADDRGVLGVRAVSGDAAAGLAGFSVPREEAVVESLWRPLGLAPEDQLWAVPLVVDPAVHGMLAAARRTQGGAAAVQPVGREVELLEALAEASAIALLNAKLYDEMRSARLEAERRSDALVRLQEASVGLLILENEAPTHDRLIEILCHVTGAPRGVYWLLDEKAPGGPALLSKGTYGFRRVPRNDTDRRLAELMARIDLASGHPVARAARSMSLVALPDTRVDEAGDEVSAVWDKTGIRSVLAVPLRARGRVLGVVLLSWRDAGKCSDEATLRTAEVIANQVAAALDTAALVEELSRANRLKDEFLATLSHELRNPLNVIVGYSEILARHPETRAASGVRHAVEVIQRNAATQARLVSDLLDLSRLQTGKLAIHPQLVELGSLVSEALAAVKPDATFNRVELDLELPDEPLLAAVDPVRVRQILWNLLDNAVKFTPPGGRVAVRLAAEGHEARLSVEDTGKGIDAAFLSDVFEMFRQADSGLSRRHGGLGIGLALVRQLVELHGGRVRAESAGPGRGALFSVWLPCERAPAETAESAPRAARHEGGTLANVRVLVVDDSQDTTRMLAQLLTIEGADVATAGSGAEALSLAAEASFDVILSDISMPEMDGYELLQALRARPRTAAIPAIAITGFGQDEDAERARAAGFAAHLTKPVQVSRLIEEVRRKK
jgi:signal transduction histidine kinase/CheY-like chemotaxis protein